MRAFLTGGSGFVGSWLRQYLQSCGDEVWSMSLDIDINDTDGVRTALVDAAPDVIYHLAALTHVGDSWEQPAATFAVNAIGTLALLEVARSMAKPPRVLLVSSAEVYGLGNGQPLGEKAPLRPVTPYAASKVAAEFIALQQFLGRGLEVLCARPFNHIGPGQADSFVVSALARRVVEAEREDRSEIRVGNLDAARDFTDVRDVVRAYRLLATTGQAGETYNVCSGTSVKIATVLDELLVLTSRSIRAVVDPELFRPVDVPVVVGDCSKLTELTGWQAEIPRHVTLADVMASWRDRLEQGIISNAS